MQAAELLGVLRGLRHEQDRGQPQQAADAHDRRVGGALQGRSVHVYHSLVGAPVVGPEQQPAERIGSRAHVEHCADSAFVGRARLTSAVSRIGMPRTSASRSSAAVQRAEVLLLAGVEVAHQVALAQRVVAEFVSLLERGDARVGHVAAHAVDLDLVVSRSVSPASIASRASCGQLQVEPRIELVDVLVERDLRAPRLAGWTRRGRRAASVARKHNSSPRADPRNRRPIPSSGRMAVAHSQQS